MEVAETRFMKLAIDLSKNGLGTASPNPVVGCVIVKEGKIIGTGYHEYPGGPHAEIVALRNAGKDAAGADVYVTLEPCSFYGRTPPCVDALIKAGVKRVIAAVEDPHPNVSGKGFEILKKAGIQVEVGLMMREAAFVNRYYLTSLTKGRPYVTLKLAMTLDGYIADSQGNSKWITSKESRNDVQELRRVHDAIVVGSGTFIKDKPKLTYRGSKKKRLPIKRFLLVSSRDTFNAIKPLIKGSDYFVVLPERLFNEVDKSFINLIPTREWEGKVDIRDFLNKLHEMEVRSLLVEGGSNLVSSFLQEGLFDELIIYTSPKFLGSGIKAFDLKKSFSIQQPLELIFHSIEEIKGDTKVVYFNPEVVFKCLQA
ncbi:MAG: bifunctional diaminohydroxyphosphoribosylaminopyrimidine deaminase/5-amino-6-(5-phosphoribosylamino)uracil reductase RibD [Actinobacteria bacterium]|nr:bifunctional diaminohydroxyphosphoribosylaminopyrimidine deaminase/5-amino-6-(5-phosphoribosylamino)uracil reductase RibD [Actinomycetota bacterium]